MLRELENDSTVMRLVEYEFLGVLAHPDLRNGGRRWGGPGRGRRIPGRKDAGGDGYGALNSAEAN
jgi:hypothetical protein